MLAGRRGAVEVSMGARQSGEAKSRPGGRRGENVTHTPTNAGKLVGVTLFCFFTLCSMVTLHKVYLRFYYWSTYPGINERSNYRRTHRRWVYRDNVRCAPVGRRVLSSVADSTKIGIGDRSGSVEGRAGSSAIFVDANRVRSPLPTPTRDDAPRGKAQSRPPSVDGRVARSRCSAPSTSIQSSSSVPTAAHRRHYSAVRPFPREDSPPSTPTSESPRDAEDGDPPRTRAPLERTFGRCLPATRRSVAKTVFLHHGDKLDDKSSSERVHVVIGNTILRVF